MTNQPNPGSDEAIDLGCTCGPLDNAHGRGNPLLRPGEWWINGDCLLHGVKKEEAPHDV